MSPMSPRLLRPRATGFDPRQIAGLALWLDASDSSTVTTASGAVSEWRSKAGTATATQGTAANRPAYTGTQNGKNVITFDGSNDVLINTSTGLLSSGQPAMTLFIAHRTGATLGTNCLFDIAQGSSFAGTGTIRRLFVSQVFGGSPAANAAYFAFGNRDAYWNNSISAANTAYIHSLVVSTANTSESNPLYYRNAANVVRSGLSGSAVDGSVSINPERFSVGSSSQGASEFYNGQIAEVLLYNAALNAIDRQRVEGYLAWKWGLQASLPYDHPYAASFPGYGTQATPSDADALAYLSAVRTADGGTGVEVGVANAVDSFVKGCKSDGTWSAIKASCILAGARTLSGALVPLAGSAPTNVNFVAADYNRKTGLVGNGTTKYLNSNRLDSADALNDVHLSTYVSTVTSAFKMYAGTQSHYIYRDNTDVYFLSRNATAIVGSSGSLTGLYGHSRAASGSFASRVGGTTNTHSVASGVATGTNVYVFGRNVSDAINSASNARLAFYSIGTSIDLALLDTRVSALYTAIGAAI